MPTVMRIAGFAVVIWPNDHRPAHVHVRGGGGEAVFNLRCPDGPPELRASYGFKLREINHIESALVAALTDLCAEWNRIHGNF